MYHQLTDHFEVAADVDTTWQFFSTASNLPRITPAWMRFKVVTPEPIVLAQDAILDYTIRWAGIPIRWRTRIIDWSPPHQFIDLQIRGPYALWHHQHTFTPSEKGVTCFDRVIYRLPGAGVGRIMHPMVARQLREIFGHRRKVIGAHLGWIRALQSDVDILKL